uniref:Coiled-coil domain containing 12 n=1 Tax=Gallus gallus TaxID=9031 RepID=A0A8V1A614_CHICK
MQTCSSSCRNFPWHLFLKEHPLLGMQLHRIIERPGLKRTTMLIQFQPPAMCRVANQQPRLPRATSSLALNACRDGASTASLGDLFQCITTLCNKNSGEPEAKQFKGDEEEETVRHRELVLRNYDPEDEELKKRKLPPAKPASVEDKVKDQLEAAKPEPIIDEVDLTNLAPRKPDWDLKRDVAKKMEKLEKRTQRAIAELIRERLKGQEEELAAAVGSAKQDGSDSD